MAAAAEATVLKGVGLLAVYSLGLGIPFVVAALAAEPFAAFLARFHAHLGLVEKAMGGLLVLTVIAFLTGAISEVSYWLLDTFPVLFRVISRILQSRLIRRSGQLTRTIAWRGAANCCEYRQHAGGSALAQ